MSSRQQEMPDLTECGECKIRPKKKGQAFKTCGGCGLVAYCCTACQTKAWRGHKSDCKLNRGAKNARDEAREAANELVVSGSTSGSGNASGLGDMGSMMFALMPLPQPQSQFVYIYRDLYNASFQGHHEELQKILLQRALDVDWAESDDGATAAFVAAQEGHVKCLSILSQYNADLSKADKDGWAPIHVACQNGRYACLEVLVESAVVDVNQPNAGEESDTPLIIASMSGHVKCLALLLDKAADPNMANSYGGTASHQACQNGHLKCLQLLAKRGANINKKDENGQTPLDYARMYKQPECVDFLLTRDAVGMQVEDLRPVSDAYKERNDYYVNRAHSRQRDARRCDYTACQACAADLELDERFKKCPRCRVAIYCCKAHAVLHLDEHESLCKELTRMCDFPKCKKRAGVKCRRCYVAAYCCKEHRAAHSEAHENVCKELRSYKM